MAIYGAFDPQLGSIPLDNIGDNDLDALKRDLRLYLSRIPDLRAGTNGDFVSCCPVHDEQVPSFHVGAKDGVWLHKCFGCGIGGSVIDLEMALTGCDTATAIARLKLESASLGECAGGPLPLVGGKATSHEHPLRATLRDVENAQANLEEALAEGRPRLSDFIESSGLHPVLKSLRIGYTPRWFFSCGRLNCRACGPRPALVIPLFYRGELLSVKLRSLKGDDRHKWMSLPGSKSDFLWLADALPTNNANDTAVIFEGIRDTALGRALGLNSIGMISATAVPERNPSLRFVDSIEQLKRAYNRVVLIGDSDPPGEAAKLRLTRYLDGLLIRNSRVPWPFEDLSDFYRRAGVNEVQRWLEREIL